MVNSKKYVPQEKVKLNMSSYMLNFFLSIL